MLCAVKCSMGTLISPPSRGTIITVKHSGAWESGRLKNPYYWRERPDADWAAQVKSVSVSPHPKLARMRSKFDLISRKLGIQTFDDWYNVSSQDVRVHGGNILAQYGDSLSSVLCQVYPEHNWRTWKFNRTSKSFWQDPLNLEEYVHWLEMELRIKDLEDWYRISRSQIDQNGTMNAFSSSGGIAKVLESIYPNHRWNVSLFQSATKKAAQRFLKLKVEELLPKATVLENFVHPLFLFKDSNQGMELDLFLPELSLAFEYQGEQHYFDLAPFAPRKMYISRDEEKRRTCAENGITLIEIPYWWDRTKESLQGTIYEVKPELFAHTNTARPIPTSPFKH